jgi:ABC-type molybdate transport system ATPase subunit
MERGVNNLPGGENQRVALARAVLVSPRLLLMEEPLSACKRGGEELLISAGYDEAELIIELSSKEIILFKQHPEAISALSLLKCTVANTFAADDRIGVELVCGEKRWLTNDETSRYGAGGHGGVRTLS